jgi:uncharacterized protein (TIGR03435 family)
MQSMTPEQRAAQNRMLQQSLLAERFHLKVHIETREMPVYDLAPTKGGLKIKPVDPPSPNEPPRPGAGSLPPGGIMFSSGGINARAITMDLLISALRALAFDLGGRPIVDKTGFTGTFDVDHLRWANLSSTETTPSQSADADLPSLTTALEEKLGLKLVPAKGQVEVVVIDSIDRPTDN